MDSELESDIKPLTYSLDYRHPLGDLHTTGCSIDGTISHGDFIRRISFAFIEVRYSIDTKTDNQLFDTTI